MEQGACSEGRSEKCDREWKGYIGRNVVAMVAYVCCARDDGVTC